MKIVADSGSAPCISAEERAVLGIQVVPLTVTLGGRSYREGVDIESEDLYPLLAASTEMPTTSQPSPGEFAATYRRLAATDPEILSIHISSGLSGTVGAARAGAELVPEANVTIVDTHTLSAAAGWQVEAAARAVRAGWGRERILALLKAISNGADTIFTLKELRYLIHGGRISHMKGLIASLLNIKPLIGVEKVGGTYVQLGQMRSFARALEGLVEQVAAKYAPGSALRVQVVHGDNEEGAATLRDLLDPRFVCTWLPMGRLAVALGAHTGPSLVGLAFAPAEVFTAIP